MAKNKIYFDSIKGALPVGFVGMVEGNPYNVRLKMNETRGAYHKGEIIEASRMFTVIITNPTAQMCRQATMKDLEDNLVSEV